MSSLVSCTALSIAAAGASAIAVESLDETIAVTRLRCEYLANPVGIDVAQPRLSWVPESARRSEKQTAYQVIAASSMENLAADRGDLWETRKVASDQSAHIVYQGRSLSPGTRAYWKVRLWGTGGRASAWSEPAWWEMGLLEPEDWRAKWIGSPSSTKTKKKPGEPAKVEPSPYFRRVFTLEKPLRSARAYICGLGYYELYLNGAKVGDHVLDPAFTHYDKRVLYVTYDISDQLKNGKNAAGVVLGNGWYNMHTRAEWNFDQAPWRTAPALILQIVVTCADGSTRTIVSDETWKVSSGPIVFDGIRNGETYDARLENTGWDTPEYDDSDWAPAEVVTGPKGTLVAQQMPAIKVVKTIRPVKLSEPEPGVHVFDMGQNFAGWARLEVAGPAGTRVTMKYGERLNKDGTVSQKEIKGFVKQGPFQTDTYILKGRGTEIWEPRFTYHGFQYVQVAGFPGKPTLDSLCGRVVHTACPQVGTFECSSELFNAIQRNTLWSYVSNYHGYPTDCPHREKNGWTGDAHLAAEQAMYNFDNAPAYTKWMNDFIDAQRENGRLPAIVPSGGWGYQFDPGPAWDSTYLLIPWYLYLYNADTRILARHYQGMKRYVDYLTGKADDHIVSIGLWDWVPVESKTPVEVTSTGYYYRDALIVAKTAELLGKNHEASKYAELAERIKEAFNRKFLDRETGRCDGGTQTASSCALYHGLIEPGCRKKVLEYLVANLESRGGHLDAGILGTKYLLHALTDNGRVDLAYTIAAQTTYPSWGYWIEQGATTLWEDWKGQNSLNHVFFGDISAWFYKALAGISPDPDRPGFKHIIIRPHVVGDLTFARAGYDSIRGRIVSAWEWNDSSFRLKLTIPANCDATVFLPGRDQNKVTEGEVPADRAEGVRFLRTEPGRIVYAIGSGNYEFTVKSE